MVSRQSAAAGHAANTSTPSAASSTSSIKPTGWIRSASNNRPALGDRTNLPSASKVTPLRTVAKAVTQSAGRRNVTPLTSGNGGGKQQKLSSFFAPNTAPPAAAARVVGAGPSVVKAKERLGQDSPSVVRARARSANVEQGLNKKLLPEGLEDDDLEARAASLLRGRFGSVSRSLNTSRASTPTRAASPPLSPPRVEPNASRSVQTTAPRRAMPPPPSQAQPQQRQPKPSTSRLPSNAVTPPRPAQQPQQPSSSPPFEPTLMQESLSNFTPLAWEKASSNKWALFQRLAGIPQDEILQCERARMEQEVAKAHARMMGSPTRKKRGAEEDKSSSKKGRMKQAAALPSSPSKQGTGLEAKMWSPGSRRRIYALETQVGGERGLQPMRALQRARPMTGSRGGGDAGAFGTSYVALEETMPAAAALEEEESETLPLPWPADEVEADRADEAGETQPLPWDDQEEPPSHQYSPQPQGDEQLEVPPSDDEDLLLQNALSSSSSSPSSSPSPTTSRLRSTPRTSRPEATPRIKQESPPPANRSPTPSRHRLSRTPLHPLPRVSPISLTPRTPGAPDSRFDRVVSALQKEERRQHKGMQLNLNSFLSTSRAVSDDDERRKGLSEDLQDVLSDDEADETQALPWSSQERPGPDPLQGGMHPPLHSSQRSSMSVRSNSSVSLPSESNLDAEGNTQLRSFFRGL